MHHTCKHTFKVVDVAFSTLFENATLKKFSHAVSPGVHIFTYMEQLSSKNADEIFSCQALWPDVNSYKIDANK